MQSKLAPPTSATLIETNIVKVVLQKGFVDKANSLKGEYT